MKNSTTHRPQFSTLLIALLCCCTAMMFTACSKKSGSAIVGKWDVVGEKSTVEFKADGTVVNTDGTGMQNGKYTFSDDTHMKMEMTLPKTDMPAGMKMPDSLTADCVVKITGDDMEIEMAMMLPGVTNALPKQNVHMKRVK